jgi:hypothetical protein
MSHPAGGYLAGADLVLFFRSQNRNFEITVLNSGLSARNFGLPLGEPTFEPIPGLNRNPGLDYHNIFGHG